MNEPKERHCYDCINKAATILVTPPPHPVTGFTMEVGLCKECFESWPKEGTYEVIEKPDDIVLRRAAANEALALNDDEVTA
jgi:hypothetical protein